MTDRSVVTHWPATEYLSLQASSTNRASKTPDDPNGWFATSDCNFEIRKEPYTHGYNDSHPPYQWSNGAQFLGKATKPGDAATFTFTEQYKPRRILVYPTPLVYLVQRQPGREFCCEVHQ